MNNLYIKEMQYTEVVIALEDFKYNNIVRCSIPSLCIIGPIMKKENQIYKNSTINIMNSNMDLLGIDECIQSNYINLYIPSIYSHTDTIGKKGTRFLVSFIGGDQNKFNVVGRCYNA